MNALSTWFSNLAPRERRLVSILLGVLSLMVFFGIFWLRAGLLANRRSVNTQLQEAIDQVQSSQQLMRSRQAKREAIEKRYKNKAPKLGGFLEQLAKDQALTIPESQDRPDVPVGKRYVERTTTFRLSKVAGLPLLRFLEKIEQSTYPVALTRLSLRKRGGEHDLYDVDLAVTAFDRNEPATTPATTAGASAKP